MPLQTWVELHNTRDSDVFRGGAEIERSDGRPPVFSGIGVLETTTRVDGPWSGRRYTRGTDTWDDFPPPPPPPGPTPDEIRLAALEADVDDDEADIDILLAKDHLTWDADDDRLAALDTLRKATINQLKNK